LTRLPAVSGGTASPEGSKSSVDSRRGLPQKSYSSSPKASHSTSRLLPTVSSSMGSGRSTPCCTVTTEDVKQVRRDTESAASTSASPRSSSTAVGAPGSHSPRADDRPNSPKSPGVLGMKNAAPESARKSAFSGQSQQEAASSTDVPVSSPTNAEKKKEKEKEALAGPSIAERRGFKGAKSGAPLSISTAKEKKKRERRRIKVVDSFVAVYKFGDSVMPSSHSGMSIMFAKRVSDGEEVVVKVRAKQNSFCDRQEEKDWRSSTEFMLNLPETEGIAKLYEVLEDKKGYYVVMEKVAGQDLFETMTGKGLLPVAEVKEVLRQLLLALDELHGRNCIHKDLKLENIMFDRTPPVNAKVDWAAFEAGKHSPVQVKLIDFDTVESVQPATPKKAKDVLGTDQYIAQEAYDGNYSAASDIFAAGVIGYRLLTSKFPFKADIFDDEAGDNWVGSPKMKEIRQKLMNYKIDWTHRVFTLEPEAKELLKAMLAVNESHRPTAKEALQNPWLATQARRKSMPDLGDGGGGPYGGTQDGSDAARRSSVGVVLPHQIADLGQSSSVVPKS